MKLLVFNIISWSPSLFYCFFLFLFLYWSFFKVHKKWISKEKSVKNNHSIPISLSVSVTCIVFGLITESDFIVAYSLAALMLLIQHISTEKKDKKLDFEVKEMNKKLDDILNRMNSFETKPFTKDQIHSSVSDVELNNKNTNSINNNESNNIVTGLLLVSLVTLIGTKLKKDNR